MRVTASERKEAEPKREIVRNGDIRRESVRERESKGSLKEDEKKQAK